MGTITGDEDNWRSKCESQAQFLRLALANNCLTDVEFLVGGENKVTVRAHKVILGVFSPVFEVMFYGSLPEVQQPILIPDLSPKGFQCFIRFIYSGEFDCKTPKEVFYTYECAEKYLVTLVMTECKKLLIKMPITTLDAWTVMEISDYMNITLEMWPKCLEFISKYSAKAFRSDDLSNASIRSIVTVLQLDYMNAEEISILEGIFCWGKHFCSDHGISVRELIRPLIELVRFESITASQFICLMGENPEYMSEEDSSAILRYLVDPTMAKLPAWCCLAGCRYSRVSKEVKLDSNVRLVWSDKVMVRASFFSILTHSSCYSGTFKLEAIEICWIYRGELPLYFDTEIDISFLNHRVPLKFRIETCYPNDCMIMRRWLPINEHFSGRYDHIRIKITVMFSNVCRIKCLSMSTFRAHMLKFNVSDVPCISDMIIDGYTSEYRPNEIHYKRAKLTDETVIRTT